MREVISFVCALTLLALEWNASSAAEAPIARPTNQELSLAIRCVSASYGDDQEQPEYGRTYEYRIQAGWPLVVRYTIRNLSKEAYVLAWNDLLALPSRFTISTQSGKYLASGVEVGIERRNGPLLTIPAGKSVNLQTDLLALFPPESMMGLNEPTLYEAGDYTIVMHVAIEVNPTAVREADRRTVEVESNAVKLTVETLSKDMRAALWARYADANRQDKRRLAWLLASNTDGQWDPRLVDLLGAGDPTLRLVGVIAIAKFGQADENLIIRLEGLLSKDESTMVRAYAADTLGRLRSVRSVPILIQLVRDRKDECYIAAIRALGNLKDARALDALEDVAKTDRQEWVRKEAAASVQAIRQAATTK